MKLVMLGMLITLMLLAWHVASGELKGAWPGLLKIWSVL
jgi:hypothetical protein